MGFQIKLRSSKREERMSAIAIWTPFAVSKVGRTTAPGQAVSCASFA